MWRWLSKALIPGAAELTDMAGKTLTITASAAQVTHENTPSTLNQLVSTAHVTCIKQNTSSAL